MKEQDLRVEVKCEGCELSFYTENASDTTCVDCLRELAEQL